MATLKVLQGLACTQLAPMFASLPVLETNARNTVACADAAATVTTKDAVRIVSANFIFIMIILLCSIGNSRFLETRCLGLSSLVIGLVKSNQYLIAAGNTLDEQEVRAGICIAGPIRQKVTI